MEGEEIIKGTGFTIPESSSGQVQVTDDELKKFGQELDPDDLLALATKEAEEREAKEKAEKEGKEGKEKPTVDIKAIVEKAKTDPNSITEEEYKALVEAGLVEDEEAEKQTQAKIAELSKKKPEELTKEEKEFLEANKKEESLISSIKEVFSKSLGLEVKGEYSDDTEGALKLVNDFAALKVKNQLEAVVKSDKNFEQLYQHFVVEKRGLDTFLQRNAEPAFLKVKVEQESATNDENKNAIIKNTQKEVLRTYYSMKGIAEDETNALIQAHETAGKLYDKSKLAHNELVTSHNTRVKEQLEFEQKQIEEQDKKIEESWNSVRDTLKKNNFNGFSIPTTDLKELEDAILTPINDQGLTKMDVIRHQRLTTERQILFDYMLLKDMKIPGLSSNEQKRVIKFKSNDSKRQLPLKDASSVSDADRELLKGVASNLREKLRN